jgi:hypothetical protein
MPKVKPIADTHWTDEEDLLLRELLHHTQPGGLNKADELSWPEIVILMNESSRARSISDRVYTKKNVQDRYYDHIKPCFPEPVDEAKEKDRQGKSKDNGRA